MRHSKLVAVIGRWTLLVVYPFLTGCALVLEYPITSASVGVWGTTGKGPTDHAVSYALNEDCETLRAVNSEPICKKTNDVTPDVVDKSFNLETPSKLKDARSEDSIGTPTRTQTRNIKAKPHKKLAKQKINKSRKKLK